MQLGNLWVENFMSIVSAQMDFRNKGLVLIRGINEDADAFDSNGAGKSTLFSEAPVWVLFGETIRGLKADKVINRKIEKNTRVALEVIDDNGDLYLIERYRKHKEHKNHVRLFRNNQNITGKSDTDTDKAIMELLQMDFSTFTNSIMFGQGISKMFASSTDSEQKKILENMLQIDIFKACQDKSKQYLTQTEKLLNELQSDIDSDVRQKETYKQSIEDLQTKEAELEKKVKTRIDELTDELNGYQKEEESLPEVSDLEKDRIRCEELRQEVLDKLSGFKEYEDSLNDLVSDKKSLQRDMVSLSKEMDRKREELVDIQSGGNIPKKCEACGQDLPLEDMSHVENHLKDAIKKLGFEWQEKKDEISEIDAILDKLYTLLKGKDELEKQRDGLQKSINDANTEIRLSQSREKEILRSIHRINKQIQEQENMLGTTYSDLIEETYNKLKELDGRLKTSYNMVKQLNKDYEDYKFWSNAFGNQGIKSVLLDSVTPFLNQRANHYLARLADSSIEVKFNTQQELKSGEKRDKFSVEVINHNGDDDYKGNSGGEKRRIDLAVNLALQDLVASRSNKRIDLIVYDECFEGLDTVGCESIIELLHEKAKSCGTVMVITHNDSLSQLFNKCVTVSKHNGKTVVTNED